MSSNRVERFRLRYGNGVTSLPLSLRLAITAPFAFVGLSLVVALFTVLRTDDPRPAALVILWFGLLGYLAWLVLPAIWTSTSEWDNAQWTATTLERQLQLSLTPVPDAGEGEEWSAYRPCPVCGQTGPAKVLRAAARCPDCQRPVPSDAVG